MKTWVISFGRSRQPMPERLAGPGRSLEVRARRCPDTPPHLCYETCGRANAKSKRERACLFGFTRGFVRLSSRPIRARPDGAASRARPHRPDDSAERKPDRHYRCSLRRRIMRMHGFFRSGTSHRLRIALNLKGVEAEYVAVDLQKDENLGAAFKALNPQGLVPALEVDDKVLIQSPAILEWLEETYPAPALLPGDAFARAHVRALAAMIGCDTHPINNRRILVYLKKELGASQEASDAWCRNWIDAAFEAIESLLGDDTARDAGFCFGNAPSMADVYLIPQVDSGKRFGVD